METGSHEPSDMRHIHHEIGADFVGTGGKDSCDYPEFALKVAQSVSTQQAERGFLICNSGIGMSIAANKVEGVRAALCSSEKTAALSREHNDANVLCLAAGFTPVDEAKKIVEAWISASFEGGRHERRVNKIKEYEKK